MTEPQAQVTANGSGAVSIGRDNNGIISTGPDARIQVSYTGRPEVTWPYQVGVVPPLAAGFQRRADPAMDLGRVLKEQSPGTAMLTQMLSGMGGIGKTQLAAAYARQLWDARELELLMWLTASSRDAILTVYAQAGADLTHRPGRTPSRSPAAFSPD